MALKVVVIGGVALGPKAAVRLKRLAPDAQVTVIDRDVLISYGGCGIPYYVSGDINDAHQLQTTSFHMVRDERYFREAKGVEVRRSTEALAIDRVNKKVKIRSLLTGEEEHLPYDKLVIATGSRPIRLNVPGAGLDRIFTVSGLSEAEKIKACIARGEVERAVVIGAGVIGLEMSEALADLWGIETTVVEIQNQVLPGLMGRNLARMLETHLAEKEVRVLLSERVLRFEGRERVQTVVTDKREIETDLVLMAVGVRPNVELASAAGLDLTESGAIKVNLLLQTSDPDIYAGGDCVENISLVTGQPVYLPQGSLANRHGRIIGTNLSGAAEEFEGVVGSIIMKVFDLTAAGCGLTLNKAGENGFDTISALVVQGDKAHFYPGMELLFLELIVERGSGRVLGLQGVSNAGEALATRINAVAALLKYKPLVRDISNLEIAYAPPYASAMDAVNALGNVAENILSGRNEVIDREEFEELFAARQDGRVYFLDVRGPGNADPFVQKFPGYWHNIPQDELGRRLDEVPADKPIIAICNAGNRSYEALLTLKQAGRQGRNLQGGVAVLKKCGLDLP